jgi:uncharacterized protein (DUF1778 family)
MAGRGRPSKKAEDKKVESLFIRLEKDEKQAFQDAAKISGAPLSVWVRERLRQAAIKELEAVGHPIEFFKKIKWEL